VAHDHPHIEDYLSDRRLALAVGLNLLLTVVEAVAGFLAGSLALLADALHNFSDCGSLVIALVARRISRLPSDERRTYGYGRAEIVGALINVTILMVIGVYLVAEAIRRLFAPQSVDGWLVVVVAGVALVVDIATAALLYALSRGNLNVRAAYLHNLADAFSSLGVIVAGTLILSFGLYWTDAAITLAIAAYIFWQSVSILRRSIHILMQGAPVDVNAAALVVELQSIPGVIEIHHLHLWEMDEHERALEAHVVVDDAHLARWAEIKQEIKRRLDQLFRIRHSTVEFEGPNEAICAPCTPRRNQSDVN
jgi:cobalt-zinc-cadmium efflux system protein